MQTSTVSMTGNERVNIACNILSHIYLICRNRGWKSLGTKFRPENWSFLTVNLSSALWLINPLQLLTDRWKWPSCGGTTSIIGFSCLRWGCTCWMWRKDKRYPAWSAVHGARWPSLVTWSPNSFHRWQRHRAFIFSLLLPLVFLFYPFFSLSKS